MRTVGESGSGTDEQYNLIDSAVGAAAAAAASAADCPGDCSRNHALAGDSRS